MAVILGDGALGAPAVTFANDGALGLYRASSGTLGISGVGGVGIAQFSASSISLLQSTFLAHDKTLNFDNTGGIGNNTRARQYVNYSGGGSGYGGTWYLDTRTSSNVWNNGILVTDAQRIGLSNATPSAYSTSNTNTTNTVEVESYGALTSLCAITCRDDIQGSQLLLTKTRGSYASKSPIQSGDRIGILSFNGYGGTSYAGLVNISAHAIDNPVAGSNTKSSASLATNSGSGLISSLETWNDGLWAWQSNGNKIGYVGNYRLSVAGSSSKTITFSGMSQGGLTIKISGGDGNLQFLSLVVELGGTQYASGNGYDAHEVRYQNAGASATRTKNNASYVVVLTAGTNPWYGNIEVIGRNYNTYTGNVVQVVPTVT